MIYERRPSQLHGYGLFATTPIAEGAIILKERDLLCIPAARLNNDQSLFYRWKILHPEDHNKLYILHGGFTDPSEGRRWMVKASRAASAQRLRQILRLNGHVHTGPLDKVTYLSVGSELARVNHSCAPNAEIVWLSHVMSQLVALRTIAPDEEITVTYTLAVETRMQRAQELQCVYGFACHCQVCSLSGDRVRDSDTRRMLLAKGWKTLDAWIELWNSGAVKGDALLEEPKTLGGPVMGRVRARMKAAAAASTLHAAQSMEKWITAEDIRGAELTKM